MRTPEQFTDWSKKRQLQYERNRNNALLDFYNSERRAIEKGKKEQDDSFLNGFTDGELEIFEDMIVKIIESKNYEIFEETQRRKNV